MKPPAPQTTIFCRDKPMKISPGDTWLNQRYTRRCTAVSLPTKSCSFGNPNWRCFPVSELTSESLQQFSFVSAGVSMLWPAHCVALQLPSRTPFPGYAAHGSDRSQCRRGQLLAFQSLW